MWLPINAVENGAVEPGRWYGGPITFAVFLIFYF